MALQPSTVADYDNKNQFPLQNHFKLTLNEALKKLPYLFSKYPCKIKYLSFAVKTWYIISNSCNNFIPPTDQCYCEPSIYIPWPFPPVWGGGVADNTKRQQKTMGVLPYSSSNDKGPGLVWMALLEQHSPSSPYVSHMQKKMMYRTKV